MRVSLSVHDGSDDAGLILEEYNLSTEEVGPMIEKVVEEGVGNGLRPFDPDDYFTINIVR
jgi:hypothetical protein